MVKFIFLSQFSDSPTFLGSQTVIIFNLMSMFLNIFQLKEEWTERETHNVNNRSTSTQNGHFSIYKNIFTKTEFHINLDNFDQSFY